MAAPELFRPIAEGMVREALHQQKEMARERSEKEWELAIDYMEGRQLEDTRGLLNERYTRTQDGKRGNSIAPVTIPLTERYVAEAANAYNKSVLRELVDESGAVDEESTKAYVTFLENAGNDESLHRIEQIKVLVGTCAQWPQLKRGAMKSRIVVPYKVHPVMPADAYRADPADPDDYLGFSVELINDNEDSFSTTAKQFVLITPAEHIYYEGKDWGSMENELERYTNPFHWPQIEDTADGKGVLKDLPLQMLIFWHDRLPFDELLIDTDVEIVTLNRELNVQWSVLLDTIRVQGHTQLWASMTDPDVVPPMMSYGSRFMLALGPDEAVGATSTANPYDQIVGALKDVVKLLAIAKRQSPNDFAFDGTSPESGFAKLVDSLPKLEARDERIRRLKYVEEHRLWPRAGSIMRYLGLLKKDPKTLKARVEFAPVEFPRTVVETNAEQEHQFKHGLSSPAKVLAKKKGVTLEEAQIEIDENRKGGAPEPVAPQPQGGNLFGGLARRLGGAGGQS